MIIDEYGHIIRRENPELSNITLEEALKKSDKEELYVAKENRVYDSIMYLNWHQRYLEMLAQNQTDYDYQVNEISNTKPRTN